MRIRKIVTRNPKARRIEQYHNLVRYSESQIEPTTYPGSFEGIIMSYSERFTFNKDLYSEMKGVWDEHRESIRV